MFDTVHLPNYVAGCGNPNAKLMIVGEAPGKTEDETGIPFSGPSGEFLWDICRELGFSRDEVWTTNVYKYRPPLNQIKRIAEVCKPEEEIQKLWKEIESVNPNCILALGDTAFKTLRGHSGITRWRGSILRTRDGVRKIVGTIHPANIVRASYAEQGSGMKNWPFIWRMIMKIDIRKALEESSTSQDNLPKRYTHTALESGMLYGFLDRNFYNERMSLDIESHHCIPVCAAIAFDKHESMTIPLHRELGGLKVSEMVPSEVRNCWHLLQKTILQKKIIGQNFKYDQDKMEMIGFRFKRGRPIWSDTLIKAHTLVPELPSKRMEMLQSIWTKMPYHKDEGKLFNPKKDKIERLFNYNGLDALSTYETDDAMEIDLRELGESFGLDLVRYFYDYRMLLHEIYLDMESIGFRVDMQAREFLKIKYQTQHDLIQARIASLAGDFQYTTAKGKKSKKCHDDHILNVAAHEQVKAFIYGHLDCPRRYQRNDRGFQVLKADEDTIVQLINNSVKDERRRSILSDIILDRRVRKTLGTYVLSKPDYDGRIRGTYRIFGPETSRSATQILQPPIRPFKCGHAFQTLTKHGDVGADIRSIYICDEGFVFIQVDLSQAEPRIVAHISEDTELLLAFESGKVDIHRRTAALALGFTSNLILSERFVDEADNLPKDGPERFMGKKVRNGGNYDMGPRELATNINSDAKRFGIDIVVSEWRAGKMVENFHRESPKIKSVFHAQIQDAINSTRTIITPYGGIRQFFGRLERETYKEGYAHLPQKTVAEHVKHSMIKIKKDMKDMPNMLMGEAHDALLFRFPIGEEADRAKLVRKHLETPIDFSVCTLKRGLLRIPCEFEIGVHNYKEMSKFKVA